MTIDTGLTYGRLSTMEVRNNKQPIIILSSTDSVNKLDVDAPGLIIPEQGNTKNLQNIKDSNQLINTIESRIPETLKDYTPAGSGLYLPKGINQEKVIELISSGAKEAAYGSKENSSFSYEEALYNSLAKIINLEKNIRLKQSPLSKEEESKQKSIIKDIKEYFETIADLNQIYAHSDDGFTKDSRRSRGPLVPNREIFKNGEYKSLKDFELNSDSLKQLNDIVLKSLKAGLNKHSSRSEAKRFVLRFLTNTVFIKNFKSEKINKAVIQALKTDKETGAKKVYEYYLTTQLHNLKDTDKEDIIEISNENSRMSSHLSQSILLSQNNKIEPISFPKVNDFSDLENILDDLPKYSKLAMNQKTLVPVEMNPNADYGIEVEIKLDGPSSIRDENSEIKRSLEPYKDLVELGSDYNEDHLYDTHIGELRSLAGGFKLKAETQKRLYEIFNIIHNSSDFKLNLSNHSHVNFVHQDKRSLLNLTPKNNGITLENHAADSNTMEINPNNNLVYSIQANILIDQLVLTEGLKDVNLSKEALAKSFELRDKYRINLSLAQAMLAAVENKKSYLLPNLLRLNQEGQAYFKTNFGEQALNIAFDSYDEGKLRSVIDEFPDTDLKRVLETQDHLGNTPLHRVYNPKFLKFILDNCSKDQLANVLSIQNKDGLTPLMKMVSSANADLAEATIDKLSNQNLIANMKVQNSHGERILSLASQDYAFEGLIGKIINRISESELIEILKLENSDSETAFQSIISTNNQKLIQFIGNKLPKDKFIELLTTEAKDGSSPLVNVLSTGNKTLLDLVVRNLPKDKLLEIFSKEDKNGETLFSVALTISNSDLFDFIADNLPQDKLLEVITKENQNGETPLTKIIKVGNKTLLDLILKNLPKDELFEIFIKEDKNEETPFKVALSRSNPDLFDLIITHLPQDKLLEVITKENQNGETLLTNILKANNKTLLYFMVDKLPEGKLLEIFTKEDKNGETPFKIALSATNPDIFDLVIKSFTQDKLVEMLTQENQNGETSFNYLAKTNDIIRLNRVVRSLNQKQLKYVLESKNKNGETPRDIAVKAQSDDTAKFLYKRLAKLDL